MIDQTRLPFRFKTVLLGSVEQAGDPYDDRARRPLIGATAAYGVALAMRVDASDAALVDAVALLGAARRTTAVNLHWALERMRAALAGLAPGQRAQTFYAEAAALCDGCRLCRAIGEHGLPLIRNIAARKPAGAPVNILTHCNAGWLATVDWGTALAPIYLAHNAGIAVHVWVDGNKAAQSGCFAHRL